MADLTLSTAFVVQVYCLARQAERSIDAALFAPWNDLTAYYKGERIAGLQNALGGMQTLLDGQEMAQPIRNREEMLRKVTGLGLIRYLTGPWAARWKKYWAFKPQELSFFAATFQAFVLLLQENQEPVREAMISLRMDFWACEYLIEYRCHGLAELPRAAHIEHFNQSDHVNPVKINQLTTTLADFAAGSPRSLGLAGQRESHQ